MKITIHQPNYMPWMGLFNKVSMAETFVILDCVQFEKFGFTNRNKIKHHSPAGWTWLSVPVNKGSSRMLIKDVGINNSQKWREASLDMIKEIYHNSPYLNDYLPLLDRIYLQSWDSLSELNTFILKEMFDVLGLKPRIIKASDLDVSGKKSELILDICKKVGADEFISGASGRGYMDMALFSDNGVKVTFQEFKHPVYGQIGNTHFPNPPFIPNLSALDLLLSCGPASAGLIRSGIEQHAPAVCCV